MNLLKYSKHLLFSISGLTIVLCCFSVRNPFEFFDDNEQKLLNSQSMFLKGIVRTHTHNNAAILSKDGVRETVGCGEIFLGYMVIEIGEDFVVLNREKESKKLFLE